jgi:hypothetical protein
MRRSNHIEGDNYSFHFHASREDSQADQSHYKYKKNNESAVIVVFDAGGISR